MAVNYILPYCPQLSLNVVFVNALRNIKLKSKDRRDIGLSGNREFVMKKLSNGLSLKSGLIQSLYCWYVLWLYSAYFAKYLFLGNILNNNI